MKVSSHRNGALSGKRVPADQNRCGMQITRGADYAVRVMIHLVQCPENALNTLPLLADSTGVPRSFLSKVLQGLSRAGYVASRRGHVGGFAILPAGRKASLANIVESIDGPFRLNACISTGIRCERVAFCVAHPLWVEAQEAMVAVLRSRTITELAAQTSLPQTALVSLQPRLTIPDKDRQGRDA
jgi:Rrf2 family protein